ARSVDVRVSNIAGSASLPDGLTYIVPDDTLVIESDGDFGYLAQGATVALTIPVRNTGRFPVSVSGVSISGDKPGVLSLGTGGTCALNGFELQASRSCSLELRAYGSGLGAVSGELALATTVPQGKRTLTLKAVVSEP